MRRRRRPAINHGNGAFGSNVVVVHYINHVRRGVDGEGNRITRIGIDDCGYGVRRSVDASHAPRVAASLTAAASVRHINRVGRRIHGQGIIRTGGVWVRYRGNGICRAINHGNVATGVGNVNLIGGLIQCDSLWRYLIGIGERRNGVGGAINHCDVAIV